MYKFCLIPYLLFTLQAEELPSLGLGSMVYNSTVIFTAKPLAEDVQVLNTREHTYETRSFVVQEVIKQDSTALPDTISVEVSNYCFEGAEFPEFIFYGRYDPPIYPHHPRVFRPTLSGIRPFRGSISFVPHQHDVPGCYYFHGYPDQPLSAWVLHTKKTMARFDSLLTLRRIEPATAQNQALFEWIHQHQYCWKRDTGSVYHPFSDCDLGDYEYVIFEWINGNGLWQDAWKSIMLSKAMRQEYMITSRPEGTSNAFACTDGRAFLMKQISSGLKPDIAIGLLSNAIWDWNEYDHLPATEAERFQAMKIVLPWLEIRETQSTVLYFIRSAVFHPDIPWKDRDGVSPLAALIKVQPVSQDEDFKSGLERLIGEIKRK